MTPDELPADMEGPPGAQGPAGLSLPPEVYEDCLAMLRQGRIEDDERRANVWWRRLGLLKAYQKQRRAFRALFESISSVRCDDGTRSYGFGPSFWAAYREAEAALNQKGDER